MDDTPDWSNVDLRVELTICKRITRTLVSMLASILPRVEGRVEIDEVDGLVLDVALEDFVVVAVIELIFWVVVAEILAVPE
jgi:hypothetical protein